MSRTHNGKQRGMRYIKNKMYKKYLHLCFCDDIWHKRNKDRTKNRLLRKRLKTETRKEIDNEL